MNEDQEINESVEEQPTQSENPVWTSVDLYYKGVHVKKSMPSNIKLGKLKEVIDEYLNAGFKPSWNDDTNKQNGHNVPAVQSPLSGTGAGVMCTIHNKQMKERTGADGAVFYSHGYQTKEGGWLWCSGKGFTKGK